MVLTLLTGRVVIACAAFEGAGDAPSDGGASDAPSDGGASDPPTAPEDAAAYAEDFEADASAHFFFESNGASFDWLPHEDGSGKFLRITGSGRVKKILPVTGPATYKATFRFRARTVLQGTNAYGSIAHIEVPTRRDGGATTDSLMVLFQSGQSNGTVELLLGSYPEELAVQTTGVVSTPGTNTDWKELSLSYETATGKGTLASSVDPGKSLSTATPPQSVAIWVGSRQGDMEVDVDDLLVTAE